MIDFCVFVCFVSVKKEPYRLRYIDNILDDCDIAWETYHPLDEHNVSPKQAIDTILPISKNWLAGTGLVGISQFEKIVRREWMQKALANLDRVGMFVIESSLMQSNIWKRCWDAIDSPARVLGEIVLKKDESKKSKNRVKDITRRWFKDGFTNVIAGEFWCAVAKVINDKPELMENFLSMQVQEEDNRLFVFRMLFNPSVHECLRDLRQFIHQLSE